MMHTVKQQQQSVQGLAYQLLALLRPAVYVLITKQGVVVDADRDVRPTVGFLESSSGSFESQFTDAVSKLIQMLKHKNVHGRRVRVYVSDYWARPLLLQMTDSQLKEEEIEVVLKAQYRRQYADSMEDWSWCWEQKSLQLAAVAWPQAGLNQLRHGVMGQHCKLAQATSLSIEVTNNLMKDRGSTWLAIVEAASISLVRQRDQVWECWLVIPADSGVTECLSVQLKREAVRRNDDCRQISLIKLSGSADMSVCRKGLSAAGWSVHMTTPSTMEAGKAYRLSQMIALGEEP